MDWHRPRHSALHFVAGWSWVNDNLQYKWWLLGSCLDPRLSFRDTYNLNLDGYGKTKMVVRQPMEGQQKKKATKSLPAANRPATHPPPPTTTSIDTVKNGFGEELYHAWAQRFWVDWQELCPRKDCSWLVFQEGILFCILLKSPSFPQSRSWSTWYDRLRDFPEWNGRNNELAGIGRLWYPLLWRQQVVWSQP